MLNKRAVKQFIRSREGKQKIKHAIFYLVVGVVVLWLWHLGSDCIDVIGGVCVGK